MGVFIGVIEILLGLLALWDEARARRVLRLRLSGYRRVGLGFIGCGCFSIVVCWLGGYWNDRLDGLTFLAETGVFILCLAAGEIRALRSCRRRVEGVFTGFAQMIGLPPQFSYRVDGREYRGISQPCNIKEYEGSLREGEVYPLYVNEADPTICALTRKIEQSNYLTIPLGIVLVIPWALYLRQFFCR